VGANLRVRRTVGSRRAESVAGIISIEGRTSYLAAKERPPRDRLHLRDGDNITLVWIENASHSLPLERPEALGQIIMSFVHGLEVTKTSGKP